MERIYGEQVYLRPITLDDTDLIIEWRNSEAVRPYFIYQKPFTREGHLNWLKTMIDSGRGFQFIVCNKEDDQPIGCTYFRDYEREHRRIEYGMFLGTNLVKSKGIGSEMVSLSLKFAFETFCFKFLTSFVCFAFCSKYKLISSGDFKLCSCQSLIILLIYSKLGFKGQFIFIYILGSFRI